MPGSAEEISEKPEVRRELERTTGEKKSRGKIKVRGVDKFWFVTHALLIACCVALTFLLSAKLIPLPQRYVDLLHHALRAAMLIIIVLAAAKAISIYLLGQNEDAATRDKSDVVASVGLTAHYFTR